MSEEYVIFTGRPNSGKSTTIRALTGLNVTVGKRPGTTSRINKYPIAKGLTLVDMPGYGRKLGASKVTEDMIKDKILDFIENNKSNIIVTVHVINIPTFIEVEERLAKKGYISLDVEMVDYLHKTLGEYPLIAANKIDKGKEKEIVRNLEAFVKRISENEPKQVSNYVFPVSAKLGIGIGALKTEFRRRILDRGYNSPFELIRQ
jgi:GTP-binding protein EngB required for normal cell division